MEEENRRICECCGANMVEYRHALNKGMTIALKELYDQGGKAHIATMKLNYNQRSNFQTLQYWGLIFQTPSPKGEASAGWWALTNLGKDFVAGGYAVRRHAWSYRGRAIDPKEKRPEYVLFSDLYPYAVQEDDLVRYKQRPEYAEDGEPHYDY